MSANTYSKLSRYAKASTGFIALSAIIATAGCGGSQSNNSMSANFGTPQMINGGSGTATAYVVTDQASVPHAIGVVIQANALNNPPALQNIYPNALPYTLPLPATTSQIPFHSVTLFTTAGHGPAVNPIDPSVAGPYEVPHLHISFSMYTTAERGGPGPGSTIAGSNSVFTPGTTGIGSRLWGLGPSVFNTPATFKTYFDSGYDLQPSPNYVPQVDGVHYVDYSSITPQELPTLGTVFFDPFISEFNIDPATNAPGAFTTEVDYAFYQGNMSSYNVTSNLDQLVTLTGAGTVGSRLQTNISKSLDMAKYVQTSGYYPTTYSITYEPATDEFKFELGNMVYRQATDANGNPLPQVKKA